MRSECLPDKGFGGHLCPSQGGILGPVLRGRAETATAYKSDYAVGREKARFFGGCKSYRKLSLRVAAIGYALGARKQQFVIGDR